MKFHNPKVNAVVHSPGFNLEWIGQRWTKALRLLKSYKRTPNHEDKTELGGGHVHLVTTMEMWENETSLANKEGKIVVVNFSAPWCGPCRQIAPVYTELSDKYTAVLFLTVNVDELAELSTKWDVKATPMFFFLKDGRELDKLIGANKADLHQKVAAVCGSGKGQTEPI